MPHPRKQEPEKYCLFCKKRLERNRYNGVLESYQRFLERKTCGVLCMARWTVKEKVQRKSYGIRARKFRKENCEGCNTTTNLGIHHKNEDWSDNAPANLMTLCASCHLKLHWANGKEMPKRPKTFCTVCGKKAEGRGFCMNHYRHFMKYGDPLLTMKSGRSDGTILKEMSIESKN